MRTGIFISAILLAVFFLGCLYQLGPKETAAATPTSFPTASVTPIPSAAPSASVPAEMPFVKVDFIKSGGISGAYRKEVQVSKDGAVYVNDNGRAWSKSLSRQEFFSFAEAVRSSDFYSFTYSNLPDCPDAYDYYLVVEIGSEKRKFEKGAYCPGSSPEVDRAAALVEALAT